MIPPELQARLKRQKYKLFGNAAAKLCAWTKAAIRGDGFCYKQKFYGIASHRCLQMTPCVNACTHNCLFCWRSTTFTQSEIEDADEPEFIIERAIRAQREMLSGFGGFAGVNKQRLEEAQNPRHAAISLSGEPTLYPHLQELIEAFHKRRFTTFVVSNGTMPEVLSEIKPTQCYLTLPASDEEMYKKTCFPIIKSGWERINESLEVFSAKRNERTVIRLTLVRGLNMKNPKDYARLIEKANPAFVEPKGYMAVGFARERIGLEFMPSYEEIAKFAEQIAGHTGYLIADSQGASRVVLLCRDKMAMRERFIKVK